MEQRLFKLVIISNVNIAIEVAFGKDLAGVMNPLTKLWQSLDKNLVLVRTFSKYVKLAQITMVHILKFFENKRIFSSLIFLKNNLQNHLDNNLGVVEGMHT